ncbi:MAG: FAD-dependent oxidoreductase [Coriobacteriales bacterium]|jgi:NADPH-dependent glutamate synthase beta subunit-like oxidoreductase|nr:FAD-dependent oxidoreductase [Coriobacteriales bacterium]
MTGMEVFDKSRGLQLIEDIYASVETRLKGSTKTTCPVEFASGFVKLAGAQSCGKCTPCRIGLSQLATLLDNILDGYGFIEDLDLITELAEGIYASADCAIGYEAAAVVLRSVKGFADDFIYHIEMNDCSADEFAAVPCSDGCPANVDIPGYMALVAAGRYTDAVSLVRKDNPFSVACGLICEHPCEAYCRRALMDDPINIRGIKRFANDQADADVLPAKAAATGKRIAIIGGGPSGLTAAYYLALMGHSPVIFEQRKYLGGMLRYGIPAYRLPREVLQKEIDFLLSAGIETHTETSVGTDVSVQQLIDEYDAVYIAIGAHTENNLGLAGEDAEGVFSAVQLLRMMGDNQSVDFSGKKVGIVGGGNVAMDAARTALRLGAKSSSIIYRRRVLDMTALPAEIEMARAEGCELLELVAPAAIETVNGKVSGLTVQPQMVGEIVDGRPRPKALDAEPYTIPCDILVLAIGQAIDSSVFEAAGLPVKRNLIITEKDASVPGYTGVFSGGDCVTSPSSAIMAIAAGKATAKNIDAFLGFDHSISVDVEIPAALAKGKAYCARSNMVELIPEILAGNFNATEHGLSLQEALQEANRCLRCDHFGLSALTGGRCEKW